MIYKSNRIELDDLFTKAAIAGCVCAIVSAGLNGLDVTKIRIQNQCVNDIRYTGLISGVRRIFF